MQAKGHQRHVLQGRWGNDSRKPEKEMAVFRRIELKTGLQWRVSAFPSGYGSVLGGIPTRSAHRYTQIRLTTDRAYRSAWACIP